MRSVASTSSLRTRCSSRTANLPPEQAVFYYRRKQKKVLADGTVIALPHALTHRGGVHRARPRLRRRGSDGLLAGDDDLITFLRRAERPVLGSVDLGDAMTALRQPIEEGGRPISDEALRRAADATRDQQGAVGYPFLIQPVGYYVWNQNRGREEITVEDVERRVEVAQRKFGSLVLDPAVVALTARTRPSVVIVASAGESRRRDQAWEP